MAGSAKPSHMLRPLKTAIMKGYPPVCTYKVPYDRLVCPTGIHFKQLEVSGKYANGRRVEKSLQTHAVPCKKSPVLFHSGRVLARLS